MMTHDSTPAFTPAPIPANDVERVQALHDLRILDTAPEPRFDRFVEMMQSIFDVPIALISLVDTDRQWFKAKVGLDVCSTDRDISFCGHAVAEDKQLIVPDTRLDGRFLGNPLVVGEPYIRFYAGSVLHCPKGHPIGTACVIDMVPRTMDLGMALELDSVVEFIEAELHLDAA